MAKRYYKVLLYTESRKETNTHSYPEDEVDGMKKAAKKAKENDNMLGNPIVGAQVKLKKDEASPREEDVIKEEEFNL